ncbi:MAG TPA: NCS2 family permease [Phycisphaerae bacterium]|nr:NCS2 family permease [Phycisphaerae bacterium]
MNTPPIVRGDIDGFFGLFVDNLLQLMLIILLGPLCGLSAEFTTGTILPGAAVSLLVGNLFYAWQARQLAKQTGRADITALPYGINTVSLIAFVFLIMAPVYRENVAALGEKAAGHLAWQVGLYATLFCAVMEIIGAFLADFVRRNTPRAALLSALAGIAITFIAMGFIFRLFANPLLAIVPLFIILISYAGRMKLPFGLPAGLVAVIVGTLIAWMAHLFGHDLFAPPPICATVGLHLPKPAITDAFALILSPLGLKYMAIIFPMGLFNIIGSLQNLESAEAAGDRFPTKPSLLVNGLGSLAAACFGSPFPTTIYIGHPGWKAMGARSAYSTLNGLAITALCLSGGIGMVLHIIPIDVTLGILLWIGIIITAQAFQEVPKSHALAVAVGLIPALAAWALYLMESTARASGGNLYAPATLSALTADDLYIHGILTLSQGYILTSILLAASVVHIIERHFQRAAGWLLLAALFSFVGLIHSYTLTPNGPAPNFTPPAAWQFALTYAIVAVIMLLLHFTRDKLDTTTH